MYKQMCFCAHIYEHFIAIQFAARPYQVAALAQLTLATQSALAAPAIVFIQLMRVPVVLVSI